MSPWETGRFGWSPLGFGVPPCSAQTVRVGQLARDKARQLLTMGLADLPSTVVDAASPVTGYWPVLLALVNGPVG
jgi:hypothetical protein